MKNQRKTMRLILPFIAISALTACAALPQPQSLPAVSASGQWYKLEKSDASANMLQTSLLAVEQQSNSLRFVQTNALGAPISRQVLTPNGWKNDGFIMPNADSRRLFAALLPFLGTANTTDMYPKVEQMPPPANTPFCAQGSTLFRYQNRDLWCTAVHQHSFVITFPDRTRWTVTPIEE